MFCFADLRSRVNAVVARHRRQADHRRPWWLIIVPVACLLLSGCPRSESDTKIPSTWISVTSSPAADPNNGLQQDDIDRIRQTIPTIQSIFAETTATAEASGNDRQESIELCGSDPAALSMLSDVAGMSMLEGRFLADADQAATEPVIVISQSLRSRWFPSQPALDQSLKIGGREFTVIGVVADSPRAESLGVAFDAWIPRALTPMAVTNGALDGQPTPTRIWIKPYSHDQMSATRELVTNLLEHAHPESTFNIR